MSKELSAFLERSSAEIGSENRQRALKRAITNHEIAFHARRSEQLVDWQDSRRRAAAVKDAALANLPELLEKFEERFSARGGQVLWARDGDEACNHVTDIIGRHGADLVVKSKSMTAEEIHLNEHMEAAGITVVESDLGELIVQLAGEKPYHIVMPAMHKSKEEIGDLFERTLHIEHTVDPYELTMAARAHLRDSYLNAKIGMTGGNFIIADEGAIVVCENEGNARLGTACPQVHIALVGIEKMLPRLADLALFLPLLATSATGQQITCYNNIFRGPRLPGETDGPEEMIVILLDNGRTDVYAREHYRETLRCIRCGNCSYVCPVYSKIGGHAYDTTYQGPIGSVITPLMKGIKSWNHLSFASSLCGACTDACPVEINLHRFLLDNRAMAVEENVVGGPWAMLMRFWSHVMQSRARVNRYRTVFKWIEPIMRCLMPKDKRKRTPRLAKESFSQQWRHSDD